MINLLSDQRKDDIRAARANVILLRYTGIVVLALLFLGIALYTSYSLLQVTMESNDKIITANDVKADVYDETRQQVANLSSQLSDTKTLLDQEVRYSRVLVGIGQHMPAGTVLDDLKLTEASFDGAPIDITAYAKSTAEASALQAQFQNSQLFGQVSLKTTDEDAGIDGYPVKISLSAVLNRTGI